MKIAIKIGIFMLALLVMVVPVVACGEPTSPPSTKEITLADAPVVLDMSSELPASFGHLDGASQGLSNEAMGLGPDFSKVELFLSEGPYQVVFAYLGIIENQVERASSDAHLRNKGQIESMVVENLRAGAAAEGGELSEVTVEVSYPDVGELAVLGSGTIGAYGASAGYDMLIFKNNKVYVFIFSMYLPGESVSLVPLAEGVDQRIEMLSQ